MRMLTIEEIKSRKRKGDLSVVADMIGITQGNASKILARPLAKKHKKLINALSKLIYMREVLKQQTENNTLYHCN